MTAVSEHRRPSHPVLELRSPLEFGFFVATNPLFRLAPKGEGRPVLVLPGFIASDTSTIPLRILLRQLRHRPKGWGLGRNMGPKPETLQGVYDLLSEMADRAEGPVPIVGWSLGGVYARLVAQEHPALVEQVISLGSPFNFASSERSALTPLWDYLKERNDFIRDQDNVDLDQIPVPSTSVFTKTDGVVSWESCVQSPGERAENIEVWGSHVGLGVNTSVGLVLADRLAQTPGKWRPFETPRAAGWMYPGGD